ncbi:MAG: hypothetical protein ACSHX9_17200 [Luteolibacter sp.]
MKTKLPLIAAICCGLSGIGSAFTLDFLGDEGTVLKVGNPPLTINVPGYGDVVFSVSGATELIVDNSYATPPPGVPTSPSLNFDMGESVTVTFTQAQVIPTSVRMGTVDVNIGENFNTTVVNSNEYLVTLSGGGNGAGLYNIKFDAVPEPSASLLGALGASLLIIRRRR